LTRIFNSKSYPDRLQNPFGFEVGLRLTNQRLHLSHTRVFTERGLTILRQIGPYTRQQLFIQHALEENDGGILTEIRKT